MASWLAPVAVVALSLLSGLGLDHDGDGASAWRELEAGTAVSRGDTDGDGLSDGYELAQGLPPLQDDADQDGLTDGEEWRLGSDPRALDSDGDGIPDGEEPDGDCDGDGVPGLLSSDDDADGRRDGDELEAHRCQGDVDGDGVMDGHEANESCVTNLDCDGDGLEDGVESTLGYDPLDPDTFRTGLSDSIAYAFQLGGQEPGADADGDGIPDPWEEVGGLIEWGELVPEPGRRDFLVEYVRVLGPDSDRYKNLRMEPAYEAVAQMFWSEGGINLTWVETVVHLDEEQRPDILTPDTASYYRLVLDGAAHTQNPFVTSVVLNPQQQQQHGGHILGAAFLRSMIATVDFGAHSLVTFRNDDVGQFSISPVLESHIVTNNDAKIKALGFDSGGQRSDGDIFLRDDDGEVFGSPGTLTWRPDWFDRAPVLDVDGVGPFQFRSTGATIDTDGLATTIAHELGHTLGLCHAHDGDCFSKFSREDQQRRHNSTMSYGAPENTLHFLESEWSGVVEYLQCPPQETVQLVADDADDEARWEAKYRSSFVEPSDQRLCGDLDPVQRQFEATAPTRYQADLPAPGPVRSGAGWIALHVLVSLAAAGYLLVSKRN